MRSPTVSGGRPSSARLQALLPLAVLLTHLAFMGSPLHAGMMLAEIHAVDITMTASGEIATAPAEWMLQEGHAGDCVIQWLTRSRPTVQAALLVGILVAALSMPHLLLFGMQPIARALGPPSSGDPQALLQVFRE